jgi:predicted metal-dependent phosphoesterase TrpH
MSADGPPVRMDMHVHTHYSYDCLSRPERLAEAARARGLDHVVVTDHNRIGGALRLHRMDPVRFLVGEEIRTAEGPEVIGILLQEEIPRGTPAREACERIRAQGGVVYLPHPFDTRRSGAAPILDRIADLVDVVEAHNARCYDAGFDAAAERWAAERGLPLGAGSDAHTLAELGRGVVELPRFEPTRESLLAALRAGRIGHRQRSTPLASVASTYARFRKRLPGADAP